MATKKIVQDIVPSRRRTIRDVALDKESMRKNSSHTAAFRAERGIRVPVHLEHAVAPSSSTSKKEIRGGKKKKTIKNCTWLLIGTALVCCVVIVYAASIFLARASVSISLRSQNVPVGGTYSAAQNAESPNLAFQVISTTTTAHVSVSASPGAVVNTYATGMAVLINAGSLSTQKIIAGTRLLNDQGLVYKTVSTVVIPAATSKSSGLPAGQAGTVAVKVIADAPGPSYNFSLTSLKGDLSIVAWQGTAKAKIFYGRMTSDVTGGSSGTKMTVGSATLTATAATLSSNLSSSAPQVLESLVPTGYILYPKAIGITLSSTTINSAGLPAEALAKAGSTTANISMSAMVTGIIFKESDLENTLAKNQIAQFPADNYVVNGLDSLVFAPLAGQTFSTKTTSVKFTLSGAINIVGVIDSNNIKSQLEGKPLSASNSVFSQYSSVIQSAQVSIVPFWIRTIPSSPKKISVVVSTSTN